MFKLKILTTCFLNIPIIRVLGLVLLIITIATTACNKFPTYDPQYKLTRIIMEISPDGKIIWENDNYDKPSCLNMDKDGNYLIASMSELGDKVNIVSANKEAYLRNRELRLSALPDDVRRMIENNGSTRDGVFTTPDLSNAPDVVSRWENNWQRGIRVCRGTVESA